jgi:hypothetical protein
VEGTASSGCGTSSRSRDPLERVNLKERHKDVYERLVAERQAWNASMLPEIAESFINFTGEELADHYGAQKPKWGARSHRAFGSGSAVAVTVPYY